MLLHYSTRFIVVFAILNQVGGSKTRIKLHIGALIPNLKPVDKYCFGSAIQVAVQEINDCPALLDGYELVLHMNDTQGHVGYALESLYSLLYTGPTKIAIIGPGVSAPTKAVAEFGSVYATLQITYSAIDPTLMSQLKYPFFFRSTPSIQSFNAAKAAFFKYFNWKRVALIYDYTSSIFFQTTDHLSKMLHAKNITTASISGFGEDVAAQMDKLQKLDARILVGEFLEFGARKVFCEAYRRKMYGAKYVWVIMQGMPDNWYADAGDDTSCNSTELLIASEGFFTVTRSDIRMDRKFTIFNKTTTTILEEIKEFHNKSTSTSLKDFYTGSSFAFDATVAVAMALDKASNSPNPINISSYRYKDYHYANSIGTFLKHVQFEGISGSMKYDTVTRERLGEVLIKQFRKGNYVNVGRHKTAEDEMLIKLDEIKLMFHNGHPPKDHATIVKKPVVYGIRLVTGVWSLTFVGFLLAFVFLVINIKFRAIKIIKMSSPRINNAICVGSMLCYVSVFIYGFDSRLIPAEYIPTACSVVAMLLPVGFTLSFGGMLSKTWRVYKVFTASKNLARVKIKDLHLFGIIFVLLLVDASIFVAWMIMSPFDLQKIDFEKIEDTENDLVTIPYIHKCRCLYQLYFTVALYGYKGILIIFAFFLAWETRKVKVPALNDSKYIGMSVYNVCVLAILGVVCEMAINKTSRHEVEYVIVAICVCLSTTMTLLLIFVPKLRMLPRKNQKAAAVFRRSTYPTPSSLSIPATVTDMSKVSPENNNNGKNQNQNKNLIPDAPTMNQKMNLRNSLSISSISTTVNSNVYFGPNP